jgi:hypothetical protein
MQSDKGTGWCGSAHCDVQPVQRLADVGGEDAAPGEDVADEADQKDLSA